MIDMGILQPVTVLAGWTMVMWWWMYITRMPAMSGPGVDVAKVRDEGPGVLNGMLPPRVQWPAHNYNHLHEAPTVFYAVALLLALVGAGDGLAAQLGWAYAGLRIIHSLLQATTNPIMIRFAVFVLSSFVLMALLALAAMAVF